MNVNDSDYVKYLKHEREKAIILVIIGMAIVLVNIPIVIAMICVFW